jgi:hypothetical protein
MMLATWLVELYLRKYSELEDVINAGLLSQDMTDRKEELSRIEDEFKMFLQVNTVIVTIYIFSPVMFFTDSTSRVR